MNQKNITLGTAGHIDHGKTALVGNLTGCETDRLKEEKERGMSIELGFAPWKIADLEVGIVDVPGHENFVKTMVAGATGIDAVIFVIAADDGVMPQTREHLDILSLLGVQHGVVVLTKVDKVLPERVETVTQEIRTYLHGTFLQNASIFPFSNITGEGFEPFYEGLANLVQNLKPKQTDGIFRLPVERTFSVKGYGTIVSGIPVSGSAGLGEQVIIYPQASTGRIKAIQVYATQSDRVQCGQCAAINVPQWDQDTISRGDVITVEGWFTPANLFLCELNMLALDGLYLKNGSSVKFHTGTSENTATVYTLEGDVSRGGERALVQVQLSQPIVAGPMDRFILRSLSPVQTIGGGVIIEALERKLKRNRPVVLEDVHCRAKAVRDDAEFAEYAIRTVPDQALTIKAIAQRIKKTVRCAEGIVQSLADSAKIMILEQSLTIHADTFERLSQELLEEISKYHREDPASPGLEIESCQTTSKLPKPVIRRLLSELESRGKIRKTGDRVLLASHSVRFDIAEEKRLQDVESLFLQRIFSPPDRAEVMQVCGLGTKEAAEALRLLTEHGRLIRVAGDMYFHTEAVEKARELVTEHIKKEKRMESVQFKYLIDATRKYALPLLDYLDRVGITKRSPDNTRFLGPKA